MTINEMKDNGHPLAPRSRRPRRRGLVLTAALMAFAVLAGTAAASAQDRKGDGEGIDSRAAAAEDVAIIAKTFGWDRELTAVHMEEQLQFGQLINSVALELSEVYGGAAYAEEPGAVSQIMVKGKAPRELRRLVEKSGLKIEIVDGMKYSERELVDRADTIVDILGEAHDEVTSAVLPTGEIQIAVSGKLDPRVEIPKELLDGVAIVEGPEDLANPEADIVGGVLVYATGGGSCTSAFSVRHNTTDEEGVATAAHCTGINRFSAPGPDPVLTHEAQHAGDFGDMEWKTTDEDHDVLDDYWASPTSYRDVSSVWPANGYAVNMVTCVHSRVQGTRSCDQIYSTNTSVKYSGFARMRNLIATDNDNTVPGDSGGPWSYSSIADGIHSGDKWIWFGTRNVFSRADNLPSALGVSVMTTP
ncbi:MAG: hypothetical protein AAF531_20570 [Actinomycetota bacterium]